MSARSPKENNRGEVRSVQRTRMAAQPFPRFFLLIGALVAFSSCAGSLPALKDLWVDVHRAAQQLPPPRVPPKLDKRTNLDQVPETAVESFREYVIREGTPPDVLVGVRTERKDCNGMPKDTCERVAKHLAESNVAIQIAGVFAAHSETSFGEVWEEAKGGANFFLSGFFESLGLGGGLRVYKAAFKQVVVSQGDAIIDPERCTRKNPQVYWVGDNTVYAVAGITCKVDPQRDAERVVTKSNGAPGKVSVTEGDGSTKAVQNPATKLSEEGRRELITRIRARLEVLITP